MKTGIDLITEIAECSSRISELTRFITSHGMSNMSIEAERERLELVAHREHLRADLVTLPDLTFS